MEETQHGKKWTNSDFQHLCTVEYANVKKLQQDHPCVLHLIKNAYLRQPAPRNIPYNLNYPELVDPSDGQSKAILRLLRNMTSGFFIECGGFDGEYLSNTLFMERSLNWTGLLIEADKNSFHQLSNRNRKSYIAPVCLSTQPYPMEVLYDTTYPLLSSIVEEKDKQLQNLTRDVNKKISLNNTDVYKAQCFPLYSILLAIGKTAVDYFGLDVEGSEYKILKTIPWHKVDIKTLTVEWDHTPEGEAAITRLLEMNKFVKFGHIEMYFSREVVYVQDFLDDLRLYE
ncbi:uncharacterized protein LOC124311872 [Daphnia pulicaria]|uniref:uncharacterized protein LOC124311872 n=1 Tax=Daphnia pulicaria TaxID=35523 RepID=UPI001EEBBDC0|nr:uncharacterized protein LOC124311872 [Daphnia pulicaria]